MSVTQARGFRASGIVAGIKSSGAPDLALVVNDGPLDVAAAVFTSNRFKAAPVLWSRQAVADGKTAAATSSGPSLTTRARSGAPDDFMPATIPLALNPRA